MRNILIKEIKLSASVLSFIFILFALMFFLPNYPILCGAFFVTLGIFQSFQSSRESNDTVFSALLPVAKRDTVKGKYCFVCLIELCSIVLMAIAAVLRMTALSGAAIYENNSLMNANLFALGSAFLIFGLFNTVFVGGFFRTAYKFGKPFVCYCVACFVTIGIAEAAHYFPGLEALNASVTENVGVQTASLAIGLVLYSTMTLLSCGRSCRRFETIDL